MTSAAPLRKSMISSLLLSLIGITCLSQICAGRISYQFLWTILFGIFSTSSYLFFHRIPARIKLPDLAISFFYLLAQSYGYQINLHGGGTIRSMFCCLIASVCLSPACAYPIGLFLNHSTSRSPKRLPPSDLKTYLRDVLLLLLAWFPVFLAFFPGLFEYDATTQLSQYLSGRINAWHPPLHTLWLGLCYSLGDFIGSYNISFGIHILSQMAAMAAIFAYALHYLDTVCPSRLAHNGLLTFFALFPVHSVLVISSTKDILFSGLFLLLALEYHRLYTNFQIIRKPSFIIRLILLSVLTCLMRNNASYALILFFPFCVLFAPRSYRMRIAALSLLCFVLSYSAYQTVQSTVGSSDLEMRESMSIPSQQMARTALLAPKDTHPYLDEIKSFIPDPSLYLTHRSDPIKEQLHLKTPEQRSAFLNLWLRVCREYPVVCADAFLQTTQGLWWMDDTTHADTYGKSYDRRIGYLPSDHKRGFQIGHVGLFPPLQHLFRRLFNDNTYQEFPVLSMLFAPALYFWLSLLIACRALLKKQTPVLLFSSILLCYISTLFLGPCILIRYCYPLIIMVPLALFMTFWRDNPACRMDKS